MTPSERPSLLVFASGTPEGGGSGFEALAESAQSGILHAGIPAVVSNIAGGGVQRRAERLNIPFIHFPAPWDEHGYQRIIHEVRPDFVALSGWLKLARGLDPRTTFNIHPGPLPQFGGCGMHGRHVHEAVLKAYHERKLVQSAVSMHFVTDEYDTGPVFFRHPVMIHADDTAASLGARVNQAEHRWQFWVTDMVVTGKISWDGRDPASLRLPHGWVHI